jgi:hypothetical protein
MVSCAIALDDESTAAVIAEARRRGVRSRVLVHEALEALRRQLALDDLPGVSVAELDQQLIVSVTSGVLERRRRQG